MSRMGRAAARVALRLYPGAWRDRYAAEVAGLIDDTDAGIGDATDLARSMIRAHMNGGAQMRSELAYRHPGAFAAVATLLLVPTLAIVALSLLGHELGVTAIADAVDPWIARIDTVRPLDLALVVAPLAAFLLAVVPLLDLRLERDEGGAALALRVRAITANLVVGCLALLVGGALVAHMVTESVLAVAYIGFR